MGASNGDADGHWLDVDGIGLGANETNKIDHLRSVKTKKKAVLKSVG